MKTLGKENTFGLMNYVTACNIQHLSPNEINECLAAITYTTNLAISVCFFRIQEDRGVSCTSSSVTNENDGLNSLQYF